VRNSPTHRLGFARLGPYGGRSTGCYRPLLKATTETVGGHLIVSAPDFAPPAPPRSRPPRMGWRFGLAILVVLLTIAGIVVLALVVSSHRHNPSSPSPSLSVPPSSSPAPSVSPSSPAATVTDPVVALKQSVGAAYLNFEHTQEHLQQTFTNDLTPLDLVATGTLLPQLKAAITKLHNQELQVRKGDNVVTDVTVTATPGSAVASVAACVDFSQTAQYKVTSATLDPQTKQPVVTGEQLLQKNFGRPRFVTTFEFVNGRWLASDARQDGNC
jgi:hypothetical protein